MPVYAVAQPNNAMQAREWAMYGVPGLANRDPLPVRVQPPVQYWRGQSFAERLGLHAQSVSQADQNGYTARRMSPNMQVPTAAQPQPQPRNLAFAMDRPSRVVATLEVGRVPKPAPYTAGAAPANQMRYVPVGGRMIQVHPC